MEPGENTENKHGEFHHATKKEGHKKRQIFR